MDWSWWLDNDEDVCVDTFSCCCPPTAEANLCFKPNSLNKYDVKTCCDDGDTDVEEHVEGAGDVELVYTRWCCFKGVVSILDVCFVGLDEPHIEQISIFSKCLLRQTMHVHLSIDE